MIKSNGEGNGARKGGGKRRVEIEAGSKGDQCHSNARDRHAHLDSAHSRLQGERSLKVQPTNQSGQRLRTRSNLHQLRAGMGRIVSS